MVRDARHHKEQIREAIQVDDDDGLDRAGSESDHTSLGAAADRASEMKLRARRRSSGEDEFTQRRKALFEPIDQQLQLCDLGLGDERLFDALRNPGRGIRKAGANREELGLNLFEHAGQIRIEPRGASGAEAGVQFIDLTIGVDPRIRLRDASFVEERRFARISRLRVNLHW